MTLSRKFFSAPTLSRALLDAARHHSVEPDAIVYRVVEKKTGFVKAPRGVLIEVDPAHPTGSGTVESPADVAAESSAEMPTGTPPEIPEPVAEVVDASVDSDEAEGGNEPDSPAAPPAAEHDTLVDVEAADELPPAVTEMAESRPIAEPEAAPASPALAAATEEPGVETAAIAEPQMPEAPVEPEIEPASPTLAAATEEAVPTESGDAEQAAAGEQFEAAPTGTPAPAAADLEETVARAVDELAHFAGLRVQAALIRETGDGLEVELDGPDGPRLVAHEGRSLLAMQHLLPRLLFHELGRAMHCRIDCEGFHDARIERFSGIARKAAERVRDAGRPWMLEPMAPDERRLVHLALAAEEDLVTESIGEGFLKRVRVSLERS